MPGSLQPLDLAAIRVAGPLEHRIQLSLGHLLAERGRILGGEGFGQAWGADQQGRWIGAVATAAAYLGEPIPVLAEAVQRFIGTQAPTGFFGRIYNDSTWWGAGRGLIGLLEYWHVTRDPAALAAATRLGEFYLTNLPLSGPGLATHHGGHKEGLVALAQATGRADFLTLAQKVITTEAEGFGVPGEAGPGVHTHSYLSVLRGCVDVYLATGQAAYLQRAEREWAHVLEHQMWVSGGISEGSKYVFETRDETCSVADWLRLSLKLWQATDDAQYLEVAEHVLLNHLSFDQDHTGGFCSYRSVGENPAGQVRDVVTWFCCSMHGLRAMLEAVKFVYAHDDDTLAVNLYVSSSADIVLAGQVVHINQTVASPVGLVRLTVQPESDQPFTLRLRVPAWAKSGRLRLNGAPVALAPGQRTVALQRQWQPHDTLELEWEPAFRLISAGRNSFAAPDTAPAGESGLDQAAVMYGPLVLMLDPVLNIYDMWDCGPLELSVPLTSAHEPLLAPVTAPIIGRGALAVPQATFMTLARQRDAAGGDMLAFFVPIAELTDRWSFTFTRSVAYEVRHAVRLIPPRDAPAFLAEVQARFDAFVQQRMADTATA